MSPEQIRQIQELMAPVFGCKPEDIEVGDGYARPKQQPRPTVNHTWTIEPMEKARDAEEI